MKLNIFKTLAWGVLVMGFAACEKDYEKADYDAPLAEAGILPTVTTGEVGAFGESAIIDASIEGAEGTAITNWGVLVSTSSDPTLAGSIKVEGDLAKTSQKFAVSGLKDGEHYYYRSFVSDGVGVAYGETKEFTTDGAAWGVQETYAGWGFDSEEEANNLFPYRAKLAEVEYVDGVEGFTFTACNMINLYGQEFYGLVSTVFDPVVLFETLSGYPAASAVWNVAGFKVDFSGVYFPKVWYDVTMMQAYFGATAPPGHFDVYVSKEPITDMAGLEAAVKIGSSKDAGEAQKLYATNMETDAKERMMFDIPMDFWGETYVYISNISDLEADYGIVVFGCGIQYTAPKAE